MKTNWPLLLRAYRKRFDFYVYGSDAAKIMAKSAGLMVLLTSLFIFLVSLSGVFVAGLTLLFMIEKLWGLKFGDQHTA